MNQVRLVEKVYSMLLDSICSGDLAVGTRLTQEWLAERLQVSRQPIGQALALLKSQGFVCGVGQRGVMVAPVEPGFAGYIYAVRGAMDKLAARSAAEACATQADVRKEAKEQSKSVLAAGNKALTSGSTAELIAADIEFHSFVYALSGNPVISDTMDLLWMRLRRVMSVYLINYDWASETWGEHAGIMNAILKGDASLAGRLAGEHAERAAKLLGEQVSNAKSTNEFSLKRKGGLSALIQEQ